MKKCVLKFNAILFLAQRFTGYSTASAAIKRSMVASSTPEISTVNRAVQYTQPQNSEGQWKQFVLLTMLCLIWISPVYALTDEAIFEDAKQFTIKLEISIKTPFIFDTKTTSTGTGFLIDKQRGWILTNAHVVGLSPSIVKGSFYKGDKVSLDKVYVDPVFDIAILRIKSEDIQEDAQQARLDCKTEIKPGYTVGAYGHPWGLNYTATRGIVSGTPYLEPTKWIQTDAPINSGNSGGPLLSMTTGHVVGVNSASYSKGETEGLNFALPIKYACKIVDLLQKGIEPSPHQLPVVFYSSEDNESLIVAKVKSFPKSELKENDVIKGVQGSKSEIDNQMDLWHQLRDKNNKIVLRIERNGKEELASIDLIRHEPVIGKKAIYIDGLTIASSHLVDNEFYNLNSMWLVQDVESGTEAEGEDIRYWGIITHINNKQLGDYEQVLELVKSKRPLSLRIQYISRRKTQIYEYYKEELPGNDIRELVLP